MTALSSYTGALIYLTAVNSDFQQLL